MIRGRRGQTFALCCVSVFRTKGEDGNKSYAFGAEVPPPCTRRAATHAESQRASEASEKGKGQAMKEASKGTQNQASRPPRKCRRSRAASHGGRRSRKHRKGGQNENTVERRIHLDDGSQAVAFMCMRFLRCE